MLLKEQEDLEETIESILDKDLSTKRRFFGKDLPEQELEENRKTLVESHAYRDHLELEEGVISLDDISTKDENGNSNYRGCPERLNSLLGIEGGGKPGQVKEKLLQLGYFSPDLSRVPEIQERVINNIIKNLSNSKFLSTYLNSKFISDPDIIENNRRTIINSRFFTEYFESQGIFSLDDIRQTRDSKGNSRNIGCHQGLNALLGIEGGGKPEQVKQRLIHLGAFSENLSDYSDEMQERISENILENLDQSKFNSAYLNPELINDPNILENNRKIIINSKSFTEYFESQGVFSLDDIKTRDEKGKTKSIGCSQSSNKILGIDKGGRPEQVKEKLLLLGFFSGNLSDYSDEIRERISENILENLSKKNFNSAYLNPNLISDPDIIENNRRIIINSESFTEYFESQGIFSLDDITTKDEEGNGDNIVYSKCLSNILGIDTYRKPQKLKQRLVGLGFFSLNLSEYSPKVQDGIIKRIFKELHNPNFSSSYLNPDMMDEESLEMNRKTIVHSNEFREYLESQDIFSLDDFLTKDENGTTNYTGCSQSFNKLLGIKGAGKVHEVRRRLIELDYFPPDLSEYSEKVQEGVIKRIIQNLSNNSFTSSYINPKIVGESVEGNRKTIVHLNEFREYLESQDVFSLDDIAMTKDENDNISYIGCSQGLNKLLGINDRGRAPEVKKRLVELEYFSEDLSNYTPEIQERVARGIVNKMKQRSPIRSSYLQGEHSEENKSILRKTRAFLEYAAQGPHNNAQIERVVGGSLSKKPPKSPKYRLLQGKWDEESEQVLTELLLEKSKEDRISYIRDNAEDFNESFCFSTNAIIFKAQELGLIDPRQYSEEESDWEPRYRFPPAFSREIGLYEMVADILHHDRTLPVSYLPVISYTTPIKETHSHVLVPVYFQGIDGEKDKFSPYNEIEKKALHEADSLIGSQGKIVPRYVNDHAFVELVSTHSLESDVIKNLDGIAFENYTFNLTHYNEAF